MKTHFHYKSLITVAVLAMGLGACGGTPYKEAATAGNIPGTSMGGTPSDNTTGSNGGTTSGSSGDTSNFLPAYQESFSINGQGGVTPSYSTTVNTDDTLKVKITAGSAGNNAVPGMYTNASAPYQCVQYNVTVLGKTAATGRLSVSGNSPLCPGAPSSAVIDFSARLTPGHGPVTITVEATEYDFYCLQCYANPSLYTTYGYYSCNMYCPMHSVYKNHTVTGTMAIQVNGTTL